jgi:hypothetical protein
MADQTTGQSVPGAFVSEVISRGSGDLAGFDIYRWFYAFDSSSPPGAAGAVGLHHAKVTLNGFRGFKYLTGQFKVPDNGAANPDIDLYGEQNDDTGYRTGSSLSDNIGTGVFIHDPDFDPWIVGELAVDGAGRPVTATSSSSTNNPTQLFADARQIRVEGFVTNSPGGVGADPAARVSSNPQQEGAGALFAMAIVPAGSFVFIDALLTADKGPVLAIRIPEPSALGFAGLAGLALAGRRHRA